MPRERRSARRQLAAARAAERGRAGLRTESGRVVGVGCWRRVVQFQTAAILPAEAATPAEKAVQQAAMAEVRRGAAAGAGAGWAA